MTSLRTAMRLSREQGTDPQYVGHPIPEDFGESQPQPDQTTASESLEDGEIQVASGSRKRKTPAQLEHPAPPETKRARNAQHAAPAVERGPSTSRQQGGNRVVAGPDPEEMLEAAQAGSASTTGSLPEKSASSPSSAPASLAWSDGPVTSTTPPSSLHASGYAPSDTPAPVLPDKQDVPHTSTDDAGSLASSSPLSSARSDIEDPGAPFELLRGLDDAVPTILQEPESVAPEYEENVEAEAPSLTAAQMMSERAKKGHATRKRNAEKAAEAAEAARATATEHEDIVTVAEDENITVTLAEEEKRPAATTASQSKRGQNAAPVATKKSPRRQNAAREASSSKLSKIVKLPLPKAASSNPSEPRATRKKKQTINTPTTSIAQQGYELLTPEQVERAGPAVIKLAQKLVSREPLDTKPATQGQPLVWADSRQALCETIPYFKSQHGGCHQKDRHVYTFLLDGVGHCREYMDSDVIIARAGGHMVADKDRGMVQNKDHKVSEPQVQAVINDIALENPLVVICGDGNQNAVCKMPHKYSVLGWYKPVSLWAEKTVGKGGKIFTTIRYRFERLDDCKPVWHQPAQPLITDEDRQLVGDMALTKQACSGCDQVFPQVYLCGWMCLNAGCAQFWELEDGQTAEYGSLLYNPAFLLDRTHWKNEDEPYSVVPTIPRETNFAGDNLTHMNTRGVCCPQCGRCSSRRLFVGWRCDNASCDYENFPQHIPVTAKLLHNPWEIIGDGPALARNKHEAAHGVDVQVSYIHGFKVYTYTFEGVNGKFVHAVSNAKINRQPRGANEMLAAMQRQDEPEMNMHLERRSFRKGKAAEDDSVEDDAETEEEQAKYKNDPKTAIEPPAEDGDLMTAFSINYGMPYKFVASGGSLPFENSPWPVQACRGDLNWASQTILDPKDHMDLNELLILAYLEGQKINYHDDGEFGLGPRIATLSLGGRAEMSLRMKAKHFNGWSKSGVFTPEKPMPHSIGGPEMYQKRLAAWTELQDLKIRDKPAYEQRRKELPTELELPKKRQNCKDLVTVTLSHGDLAFMEGYEIQQYFEHKVIPEQSLRFALTCRTVLPNHLKPEERPAYHVGEDDESLSGLRAMVAREQEAA